MHEARVKVAQPMGLVLVKGLPFAAACLGDMFDLAQTNQPEGMDFLLQHTAMEE